MARVEQRRRSRVNARPRGGNSPAALGFGQCATEFRAAGDAESRYAPDRCSSTVRRVRWAGTHAAISRVRQARAADLDGHSVSCRVKPCSLSLAGVNARRAERSSSAARRASGRAPQCSLSSTACRSVSMAFSD